MSKRILLIQGHPDASAPHLCHALAASYTQGAQLMGHTVRQCDVAALEFPLLRSQKDFDSGALNTDRPGRRPGSGRRGQMARQT